MTTFEMAQGSHQNEPMLDNNILEMILIRSKIPITFLVCRRFYNLCPTVVKHIAIEDLCWFSKVSNQKLVLATLDSLPLANEFKMLHRDCRSNVLICREILKRSEGWEYLEMARALQDNLELSLQALRLTDGYAFGFLPRHLSVDEAVIRETGQLMGIEDDDLGTIRYQVTAVIDESWEDILT